MSNEQVKELLDMVMALPKSENYNMQFTYDIIKKFIEKWHGIIEKENENDRGNN